MAAQIDEIRQLAANCLKAIFTDEEMLVLSRSGLGFENIQTSTAWARTTRGDAQKTMLAMSLRFPFDDPFDLVIAGYKAHVKELIKKSSFGAAVSDTVTESIGDIVAIFGTEMINLVQPLLGTYNMRCHNLVDNEVEEGSDIDEDYSDDYTPVMNFADPIQYGRLMAFMSPLVTYSGV